MNPELLGVLVLAVPALPALLAVWFGAALAIGVHPRERTVALAALLAIGFAAVASVTVLVASSAMTEPLRLIGFWIDPLAALMMTMTTTLSFVVVWFSVSYLHREAGFLRYFALVELFITGMLLLVMADGLVLLLVGWEWVGVASALLIGFFHERATPVRAGARALFTSRFGDLGLLTAVLIATHAFGGSDWAAMQAGAGTLPPTVAAVMGLSLCVAAMARSAQLPFSSWMVHAVEAPTTSTGLLYGAVMAHGGVYLMLRTMPIIAQSDVTMIAMLVIGGATLVYATAAGAAQSDAKSRLMYATIAQQGGMFAACGAGAWQLVVVLMVVHAGLRAAQFRFAPSIVARTRGGLATIRWVALRQPERRNPDGLAAWLHHLAIDRFRLDELQHTLAVRPVLAVAAALARFEERHRDRARWLVAGALLVAGLLAIDHVTASAVLVTGSALQETSDHALPWLSLSWIVPGAAAVLVWCARDETWARTFAHGGALGTLALALGTWQRSQPDGAGMQFVERVGGSFHGLTYQLGVDAIDIRFVLLQATVVVLLLGGVGARSRRETLVATLACQSLGMLALVSTNLLVTALCGLLAIIPGAALLGADGPRLGARVDTGSYWRPMAVSGVLLLGVVIALGMDMPTLTFDFESIAARGVSAPRQAILFVPFVIAVAIRLPMVPFHGWMVRVIESSSAISAVTLTLLPFAHYVFLRIGVELLGDALAHHAVLLASYAVVGMGYAVLVGLAQANLRSSLAYFQLAIGGTMLVGVGVVDAFSLGVAFTGLLLCADIVHARVGTTDYAALGGLVRTAPALTGLLLVIGLASAGVPGTLGFVAGHLASHGASAAHPAIAMAMLAVVELATVLLWWSFIRTCLGPWRGDHLARFPELIARERAVLLAIAVVVIVAAHLPTL